jgi:DNA polymerase (family X)
LIALAAIRGDTAEATLLAQAKDLAARRGIVSEGDLEPLFDLASSPTDAGALVRLRHIHEAGGWVLVESTLADIPADLRWLYESGAVTLPQLETLHRALGVTSAADLAAAVEEQRVRGVAGLESVEPLIVEALPNLRRRIPRIPLGRAVGMVDPLLDAIRTVEGVQWAEPAGSLRRGQDMVGDLELIVSSDRPADVIETFGSAQKVTRWLHRSERRAYALVDRVQIGVRVAEPPAAAAALLNLTGSADHVDALRAHAAAKGLRLSSAGLFGADQTLCATPSEEDIYAALGIPFIAPEIRHGEDEIEAALRGELPRLVTRADIRGDLHMHTTFSDGRDSVATMVEMCRTLGYEYLAITDHSPHSAAARNLTPDGVKRQAAEIAALRERYPEVTILHGCEVDILPDGTLDFSDRVLERFDLVLASLHERAGQEGPELLARYVRAMQHPLVTLITHPTNRLVPIRDGYDLDYERLFAAAVETNTIVEIDGSPAHLDLDGTLARLAIEAGATVCIDSDCHRADMLERQMQLGLLMARRGWIEPRHVLNARPIDEVRHIIAAKRGS